MTERETLEVIFPTWLPRPTIPVTVVCGPPGSGKTTYVAQHADEFDLVIDVDVIAADLFGLPLYRANKEQRLEAVRHRNKLLARLADDPCPHARAWLIVTAGTAFSRDFWRSRYGNMIVLDTPKHECIRRVLADKRRLEVMKFSVIKSIRAWR